MDQMRSCEPESVPTNETMRVRRHYTIRQRVRRNCAHDHQQGHLIRETTNEYDATRCVACEAIVADIWAFLIAEGLV